MIGFRLLTPEEVEARDSDPRNIEWNAYLARCAANARAHCGVCGRFARPAGYRCGDIEMVTCSAHGLVDA